MKIALTLSSAGFCRYRRCEIARHALDREEQALRVGHAARARLERQADIPDQPRDGGEDDRADGERR